MFKKLLLSLIVGVPVIAQADWVQMNKDDEYQTYIDPDRVVATNKTLEYADAWLKMVVHTDLSKDGLTVGDYKLVKFKFKCDTSELTVAANYDYKNGKVINSYVAKYDEFRPVIPDSQGEYIALVVCGYLFDKE